MFTTLKTVHWGRLSAGLVVIFSTGGLWYETGFATRYPDASRLILLGLAIVTLLYNSSKTGDN
jgi:hypothetical protein